MVIKFFAVTFALLNFAIFFNNIKVISFISNATVDLGDCMLDNYSGACVLIAMISWSLIIALYDRGVHRV